MLSQHWQQQMLLKHKRFKNFPNTSGGKCFPILLLPVLWKHYAAAYQQGNHKATSVEKAFLLLMLESISAISVGETFLLSAEILPQQMLPQRWQQKCFPNTSSSKCFPTQAAANAKISPTQHGCGCKNTFPKHKRLQMSFPTLAAEILSQKKKSKCFTTGMTAEMLSQYWQQQMLSQHWQQKCFPNTDSRNAFPAGKKIAFPNNDSRNAFQTLAVEMLGNHL